MREIKTLIDQFGKTQNFLAFHLIAKKYDFALRNKIKKLLVITGIALFLSCFLFENNGLYFIGVAALMMIAYLIVNRQLNKYTITGEILFFEKYFQMEFLNNPCLNKKFLYSEIVQITSRVDLEELIQSPRKPTPLISLNVDFHFESESISESIKCAPHYKVFDGGAFKYRYWLESVLKKIDSGYSIKDSTLLNEFGL